MNEHKPMTLQQAIEERLSYWIERSALMRSRAERKPDDVGIEYEKLAVKYDEIVASMLLGLATMGHDITTTEPEGETQDAP